MRIIKIIKRDWSGSVTLNDVIILNVKRFEDMEKELYCNSFWTPYLKNYQSNLLLKGRIKNENYLL